MKRHSIALIPSMVAALWLPGCKPGHSVNYDISHESQQTEAFCQVSGNIVDALHSTALSPRSQFVRLRFDAEDLQACRSQTIGYCAMRLAEGLPPVHLEVTFREKDLHADDKHFAFATDCTLHPM